ncbi:MAG: Ig-like domain repeat protein [Terracidiphilus sp.]
MMRSIGSAVEGFFFFLFLGWAASNVLAQTTNYSIPAGSGTLTYTETVAINGTCPISQPPAPSQQITQYTFSGFAYNGQPLSGSVAYLSSPSQSSYCPTSGWTGAIPSVLSESGFYVFFTPSLSGAGSATTNALTLSANQNPSVYGSNVQFTATEQFPNASGTVTFSDGSTTLGSEAMGNRSSSYSTASLSVGSHSITAAYISNNGIPSTTSPALSFTVNKVTPSLSVSCSPNPITYGTQNTTCTATVSSGTGTVSWTANGSAWTTTTLSGGSTSATGWSGWSPGNYPVGATYSGDGNDNSAAGSTTITIVKATPSGSISCSPSTITYGSQTSSCTATVAGVSGGAMPTQSATLYWNGNNWGTNSLSNGSAGWSGFNGQPTGSYSVTGTYSGDGNYNGISLSGTTVTIQKATPNVSVSCSPNPITYGAQNTTCTATVSGGATGTVSWTANGSAWTTTTLSGGSTSASGWSGWSPGTYPVGATYNGDGNNNSVAGSTTITIVKATPSGSISCSPSTITYGSQTSSCTATVAGVSGGATPTQTVTLYWNGNNWGTNSLSNGSAGWSGFNGQPTGSYSVTGTYSGDGNYNGISLSAATVTIQKATPTVSVSCSPASVALGTQATTCTASVPASDGFVTFYSPTTLTGEWWNGTTSSWYPATGGLTIGQQPAAITHDGSLNYNITGYAGFSGSTGAPNSVNTTEVYARWTGTFVSTIGGTYTIGINSDDGANVYVNGTELVSNLAGLQGAAGNLTYTQSGTIALTAGATNTIVVEFQQNQGGGRSSTFVDSARAKLSLAVGLVDCSSEWR